MPVVPDEVKWQEDNELTAAPVLTEEEQDALKKRMAAMDKVLAAQQKAKYKIEVHFTHRRTGRNATAGMLSIWESGAQFHGGGDTKIYICPTARGGCDGIIPYNSQGYGYLVCPTCKKVWQGSDVDGEVIHVQTVDGWARVLLRWFVKLNHNADIYIKYPKMDIRAASRLELEKDRGGEKLAKTRAAKDVYIYTLRAIIKDSAAGGDLFNRFKSLLSA